MPEIKKLIPTSIDIKLQDRLRIIATGDYRVGFDLLCKTFEARRLYASLALQGKVNPYDVVSFLDLLDKDIKKVFGIN